MIDPKLNISLNKQFRLLQVSKLSFYYTSVKPFSTLHNISVLDAINNIYSEFPSYRDRRMTKQLQKDVRDYAGRVVIEKVNQVWSTDITYIKLETGFV